MSNAHSLPGGKGNPRTPLNEAEDRDLAYWQRRISGDLEKDPDSKYAAGNRELLGNIEAEQSRRKGGGQKAPSQPRQQSRPSQGLVRRDDPALAPRSFGTADMFTAELKRASDNYTLVAPSTICARIPEGFEGAISYVWVDPDDSPRGPGEVYSTGGGKLGLSKAVLDKIGGALGVSWDPAQSGRLDDGSDPRYVHYKSVGTIRQFDGTLRTIVGEKEMDLRDGSPQIEALHERVEAKNRRDNENKSADKQIREMRLHILSHAETKARLRAIRTLGIKTGYTAQELEKPFGVAKLMWTGHSEDPELRRTFAVMGAQAALGSATQAYGPPVAQAQQLAPPPQAARLHAPPPVGAVGADDSALDADGEPVDYDSHDYGQDEHQAGAY